MRFLTRRPAPPLSNFVELLWFYEGLTPPHQFERILRFQRALREIETRRSIAWADIAARCGYFDQSHFIHDFRTFSGLNPSAYLKQRGEDPNFVPIP